MIVRRVIRVRVGDDVIVTVPDLDDLASRAAAEQQFCWEREAPHLLAAVARALA